MTENGQETDKNIAEYQTAIMADSNGHLLENLSQEIDTVLMISGPFGKNNHDEDTYDTPENRERVTLAVAVYRHLVAKSPGKRISFIINGAVENVNELVEMAYGFEIASDDLTITNCGPKAGDVNTKTQIAGLAVTLENLQSKHVAIVTSWYHGERVRRTAKKQLPEMTTTVVGVAVDKLGHDETFVEQIALTEAQKFQGYILKGHIVGG